MEDIKFCKKFCRFLSKRYSDEFARFEVLRDIEKENLSDYDFDMSDIIIEADPNSHRRVDVDDIKDDLRKAGFCFNYHFLGRYSDNRSRRTEDRGRIILHHFDVYKINPVIKNFMK